MVLADLGANVIKVEPPEGDATRGWGPPWVGDEAAGTRTAAYFLAVNRNKRSIRLDLATARGSRGAAAPAHGADVLVENLRPGALAAIGLHRRGAARVRARPHPSRDLGLRSERSRCRAPGLRLRHPGCRRAHVHHRRRRRGRRTSAQGRRRDQRRRLRSVRGDRDPCRGDRTGPSARRRRPAGGCVAPCLDARGARQPGPERVRVRCVADPPRQCAPEHRPVRDVRDRRRRVGDRRRIRAPVGALLRRPRPWRSRRGSALRDQWGSGREPGRVAARHRITIRNPADGRLDATLEAADIPVGPIADVLPPSTPRRRARCR